MTRAVKSCASLGDFYAQMVWAPKSDPKIQKRPKLTEDLANILKKKIPVSGTLVVNVCHATKLPGLDKTRHGDKGLSDPYVELIYPTEQSFKTKIKNETNTPIWNERFANKITVRGDDLRPLRVIVWDRDEKSNDDIIGFVDIDLKDVYKTPKKWIINDSLKLKNPKNRHFQNFGSIYLQIKMLPGS